VGAQRHPMREMVPGPLTGVPYGVWAAPSQSGGSLTSSRLDIKDLTAYRPVTEATEAAAASKSASVDRPIVRLGRSTIYCPSTHPSNLTSCRTFA